MKTKLTKRLTLKACMLMWNNLAYSGEGKTRLLANRIATMFGLEKDPLHYCFACQYVSEQNGRDVLMYCDKYCPMNEIWGKPYRLCACEMNTESPFNKWEDSHSIADRKKYAVIIADGAKKLLEREMKKG